MQFVGVLLAGSGAPGVRSHLFDSAGERVMWRLRLKLVSQVCVGPSKETDNNCTAQCTAGLYCRARPTTRPTDTHSVC